MERDIVERLRGNDLSDNASGIPCLLCLEAADEIERLRAKLKDRDFVKHLHLVYEAHPKDER